MENGIDSDDDFVFTYATLRPYLGRVVLSVSHVDWRDLQAAGYVLEDVREALDACLAYIQTQSSAAVLAQGAAIERVFDRLKSAEAAPAIHRPHAGVRLAREFGEFVGTYYVAAFVDEVKSGANPINAGGIRP